MEDPVSMSKAQHLKALMTSQTTGTAPIKHSGLTIGTGLPIGAPVKTVGDVLALIQKYVGGGGGGGGQQGPSGPQGLPGPQGEVGSMGPAGPAGPIGPEGISAYEVALINGFEGTEEEWLASLVGAQGEPGEQGPQGIQGEAGPAGADGEGVPVGGTTGQVLAKASNDDQDVEWVDPPTGGGGGATSLDELTDVDLTTPPTDGQVLVYDADLEVWVPQDPASGGGGSGGYFKGATAGGITNAGSTSAFATKGMAFTPHKDCTVDRLGAFIGGSGSPTSAVYYFQIASLSSLTIDSTDDGLVTAGTVGSVLGTTNTSVTGTSEVKWMEGVLSSPVNLVAGQHYVVVAVFDQALTTGANRIATPSNLGQWIMNAPVKTYRGSFQYASVGLSASQTPNTLGNGSYTVSIEGTF